MQGLHPLVRAAAGSWKGLLAEGVRRGVVHEARLPLLASPHGLRSHGNGVDEAGASVRSSVPPQLLASLRSSSVRPTGYAVPPFLPRNTPLLSVSWQQAWQPATNPGWQTAFMTASQPPWLAESMVKLGNQLT